jgi:hypothetical protein
VVNEKKECRKASYTKTSSYKFYKLKNRPLNPVDRAYCEQQGENEKAGRVPDNIVTPGCSRDLET